MLHIASNTCLPGQVRSLANILLLYPLLPSLQPTPNSTTFRYIWLTRPDILGGLEQLVQAYQSYLAQTYGMTLAVRP
jgi:hypothetical protein